MNLVNDLDQFGYALALETIQNCNDIEPSQVQHNTNASARFVARV